MNLYWRVVWIILSLILGVFLLNVDNPLIRVYFIPAFAVPAFDVVRLFVKKKALKIVLNCLIFLIFGVATYLFLSTYADKDKLKEQYEYHKIKE